MVENIIASKTHRISTLTIDGNVIDTIEKTTNRLNGVRGSGYTVIE